MHEHFRHLTRHVIDRDEGNNLYRLVARIARTVAMPIHGWSRPDRFIAPVQVDQVVIRPVQGERRGTIRFELQMSRATPELPSTEDLPGRGRIPAPDDDPSIIGLAGRMPIQQFEWQAQIDRRLGSHRERSAP